eukprot:1913570-Pleurochrysis_carterae.AAC.1
MENPSKKEVQGEVCSHKAIFLGKKSYIDVLKDEGGNKAYHMRMKGIPTRSLLHKIETEYEGKPYKLYLDLANGEEVTFDMTAGGSKACFKTQRDHTVHSVKMNRTV